MPAALQAQTQPPPPKTPDLVVFTDGEQLTGELETADGGGITFKSPVAGEVKIAWANIKTLHSSKQFAILLAKQKLNRKNAAQLTPVGEVSAENKVITVTNPSGAKSIPVGDAGQLLAAADFNKAVSHELGPLKGWGGAATGGVTLVRATQDSTTFNGAINLTRSTPEVSWLPPRDRTIIGYTQSYGTTTQANATPPPPTTTVETNIFHANAERDQYFSPRLYAYGSTTFDHNYSSNLGLEQAYGGGIGMTFIKNAKQEFDFKGDVHYEKEVFFDNSNSPTATTDNQNIFGSTFSETYIRHLTKKGPVLNELGTVSPAWSQSVTSVTQPNAFSAHLQANLVFPVYKGLGFNVGGTADFINNAPVGSKRNSEQFTMGIAYTIKPKY